MLNRQGRPTAPQSVGSDGVATFTGNRALLQEEPLLFEIGRLETTGVDIPEPPQVTTRLGGLERTDGICLPGLSEPEAMRHYVRLSQKNYGIDTGLFPLGSCTMKHNPRLNEKMARLPGFGDIHPLQPVSTVQGALELMTELSRWLVELTGMAAVALSPKAGAHGELCGMMAIKAAIAARGEAATRRVVLVPESAHGTNPATAALIGFEVRAVPARDDGTVDPASVRALLGPDVAAIMLTNPNTCGLFERDIVAIAAAMHEAGGYFYCDGANFNAIVGKARPGDLGVDAMHINLHKTFSTPHGGGGPGGGPVAVKKHLEPFLPVPRLKRLSDSLTWDYDVPQSIGKVRAFYGNFGVLVRALAYILAHGGPGLRNATVDAVLNANYIRHKLAPYFDLPYKRANMHEVVFSDDRQAAKGVRTGDMAKRLIDYGFHPYTVSFPLIVHGALMIEPTETESKQELDLFIDAMISIAKEVEEETETVTSAPHLTRTTRVDEVTAARKPIVRWKP